MGVRSGVFDAVRKIVPPGTFNDPGNIHALDNLLDALGAAREGEGRKLGALSERFESGGRGVGVVSSGRGDPGGVSYGIWQLASKTGTCAAFVAHEGQRWRDAFAGHAPGSQGFSLAWKAIADREPDAFADAQHAFIKRTHYDPAVAAVLQATTLDLDKRHEAVRDAVWSVSVQHGRAAKILTDAVKAADMLNGRTSPAYDKALVNAIYTVRSEYVRGVAAKSDPTSRKTLLSVVANRYPAELAAALAMFV